MPDFAAAIAATVAYIASAFLAASGHRYLCRRVVGGRLGTIETLMQGLYCMRCMRCYDDTGITVSPVGAATARVSTVSVFATYTSASLCGGCV